MPISVVIFGITGDLARSKLITALFDLYCKKKLSEDFSLIGYGRKKLSAEEFSSMIHEIVLNNNLVGKKSLNRERHRFIQKCEYAQGELEEQEGYDRLRLKIKHGSRVIYFLAVHPELHTTIIKQLGREGLLNKDSQILVEKPFGHDVASARSLDMQMRKFVKEEQIYRIDHYLGKAGLADLVKRRCEDLHFERMLEKEVAEIHVSLWETKTVGRRGAFYDRVGALKDVGQNHLLQMLATVLAERNITSDSALKVQKARADALASLRLKLPAARAQYRGYHDEQGVAPNSKTETFFSIEAASILSKHKHIKLVLSAGKALAENGADIRIVFKGEVRLKEGKVKEITFSLNPKLQTEAKKQKSRIDAYERIFLAAIAKDQKFFCSLDESIAGWKFDRSVRKFWQKHSIPLETYDIGEAHKA